MSKIRIKTTQNIELEYRAAGVGQRCLAYMIDNMIFIALFSIIFAILFEMLGLGNSSFGMYIIFAFLGFYAFYDLICETWLDGQSIGKRLMKIKVVRTDGARAGVGDFLTRWMFRLVDITLTSGALAVLMIAFSEKRQRLGDLAAGTTVISLRPPDENLGNIFTETADNHEVTYPQVINLKDKDISLIKEILGGAKNAENTEIVFKLYKHLEKVLGVKTKEPPRRFIETVLKDYNHINSQ